MYLSKILLELSKQKNFALKSLQLIADLLREEMEGLSDEESNEDRKKQYEELHTKKRFVREGICATIPSQLSFFSSASFYDAIVTISELTIESCSGNEADLLRKSLVPVQKNLIQNCAEEEQDAEDSQIYCPLLSRVENLIGGSRKEEL
jgi:hypothetical protein